MSGESRRRRARTSYLIIVQPPGSRLSAGWSLNANARIGRDVSIFMHPAEHATQSGEDVPSSGIGQTFLAASEARSATASGFIDHTKDVSIGDRTHVLVGPSLRQSVPGHGWLAIIILRVA